MDSEWSNRYCCIRLESYPASTQCAYLYIMYIHIGFSHTCPVAQRARAPARLYAYTGTLPCSVDVIQGRCGVGTVYLLSRVQCAGFGQGAFRAIAVQSDQSGHWIHGASSSMLSVHSIRPLSSTVHPTNRRPCHSCQYRHTAIVVRCFCCSCLAHDDDRQPSRA